MHKGGVGACVQRRGQWLNFKGGMQFKQSELPHKRFYVAKFADNPPSHWEIAKILCILQGVHSMHYLVIEQIRMRTMRCLRLFPRPQTV